MGNGPTAVALSPDGARLYVANQNSNTVSVVDTSNNTVIATVPVGSSPAGIAANPNGSTVFVTNSGGNSVSVISTSSNTVTAMISAVGAIPIGVAFNAEGTLAFVVKQNDNAVTVIDTATNIPVGSDIPVGSTPFGIAVSPDGSKLYVSNQGSDTVSVISVATRTAVATIGADDNPFYVAFSPDGRLAYATNIASNTVAVFDAATDSRSLTTPSIAFPALPVSVAFAPSGLFAYVTLENGTVAEIDTATHTVLTTRPTITVAGTQVSGMAISPDGASLYVANTGLASVSVRDLPLPAVITSGAPPAATVGAAYSFTVVASGRPAPTFLLSSGALPAGLTLDPVSGMISGTPASGATSSTFTIAAGNQVGPAATATYTITVPSALPATGPDAAQWLVAAALLVALGSGLTLARCCRIA